MIGSTILVCPISKRPLHVTSLGNSASGNNWLTRLKPCPRTGIEVKPLGSASSIALDEEERRAYPIVDAIPILLAPEMLCEDGDGGLFDLSLPQYREAYEEMDHYNKVAFEQAEHIEESEAAHAIKALLECQEIPEDSFPAPYHIWLDSVYDCVSQWHAYQYVASLRGKTVLQLGGKGIHAVKALLAGAYESWLLTPSLGEALCARALARLATVGDRLHCAVGVAEEIPFADNVFDAILSGGCLHHTVTQLAMPEIHRILKPGGRLTAWDPWKGPLYRLGISIFGKRDTGVHCRPLEHRRIKPLYDVFSQAEVKHSGTFTRYPLLALQKMYVPCSLKTAWRIFRADDSLSSIMSILKRQGSSVAVLATKLG